ncbi:hypothetical protein J8281_17670 [Aquimarina sp. U1-2]|uniref:hypothetical protein n=1 Tax=Aquimarina sp. U1-2 TaxID=2823141 RepID=UPI001AECD3DE|nr:hypothetical protein [Aquimarina sp. U1-2]MBP2834029.1 hypothetical protein [Aquimarina sp. U1-2]
MIAFILLLSIPVVFIVNRLYSLENTILKKIILTLLVITTVSCGGNDADYQNSFDNGIDIRFAIFTSNIEASTLTYQLVIYESQEDWLRQSNSIYTATISDDETVEFPAGIIKSDQTYYIEVESIDGQYSNWNPDQIEFLHKSSFTESKPSQYHSIQLFKKTEKPFPGLYRFKSFYEPGPEDEYLALWEGILPVSIEVKRDFTVIITDNNNGSDRTITTKFYKKEEVERLVESSLLVLSNGDFIFKDQDWFRSTDNGFSYGGPDFMRGFRLAEYVLKE